MQKRNSYLIGRAFKNYLTASVLTVAATQVANIADASIVGNLIGPEALAAVNMSKPVLQTFYAISILYIASATMLAGIAIGRGDKAKANSLFSLSMLVSLILGVLFVAGGLLGFDGLSHILCSSDSIRPMMNDFMLVTILSSIPQLVMFTLDQFVTVDGSPQLVTRAVIVGNIFNIAFDIIFIKFFDWGIAGAGWATFIMYVVCSLMVLPHFKKKDAIRLSAIRVSGADCKKILSLGIPLFFSTVLLSVQYVGNNYVSGTYMGDGGLIAMAVCMQLFTFSMVILTGVLRTIQPVGAILRGHGDDRGMLFLIKKAYTFLAVCMAVFALLLTLFPTEIANILGANNEASLPVIMDALPQYSLFIAMQALLYNLIPIYQFYNHPKLVMIISMGQPLLPMICFWLLGGGWIGFFLGQAIVAVIILICTTAIRLRNKSLTPVFLIPRGDNKDIYDVSIDTNIASMGESRNDLLAFLQKQGLEQTEANRYVLCTEELVKNIIEHGHAHCIDIRATATTISIHDDGKAFNPLEYQAPSSSTPQSTESLGLKIVQGMGINITYDYRFNQNMIKMEIK